MNKRYIDMPITTSGGCPSTEATHRSVHDVCDVCDESESVHTHMSTWACAGVLLTHRACGGCRPVTRPAVSPYCSHG